ncbi:hypothetical protein CYY_003846 [Polysphondylium violaceum]|uniref:Uncharacterized protein n=1 Tax=Polysphondylium violaceum TaxID=133409 RepID=A0A8J4PVL9_9MYCE|nr:hypothetical protein CYY_003846 [Polysphondylium violaceum]
MTSIHNDVVDDDDDNHHNIIISAIQPYLVSFNSLINDIGYSRDEQAIENDGLSDDLIKVIIDRMNKFKEKINQLLLQKDTIRDEINLIMVHLNLLSISSSHPDEASSLTYISNDVDTDMNDQYTVQDRHIVQVHKDLFSQSNDGSDNDSYKPNHQLYVILKQYQLKHKEIVNVYEDRSNVLDKLYNEMKGLCIEMGIDVNQGFEEMGYPSSKRIRDVCKEIQKLKDIKSGAMESLGRLEQEIRALMGELDSAPANYSMQQLSQLLNSIGSSNKGDLKSLVALIRKLESISGEMKDMKAHREREIKRLNQQIKKSYVQLGIAESDNSRIKFNLERSKIKAPLSVQLLALLQSENKRLNQLKKDKFKDIYDGKAKRLHHLWTELCIPESERILNSSSTGDASDEDSKYSTENLEYMDQQITHLSELLESMKAILAKVKRREFLKEGMKTFEKQASDDSNRFKGSSVRLLEEAKFRKIVSKEFPKLTEDLQKELTDWEQLHQKRFFYYGTPYLVLMNSETERPDFDLLHLRLSTKNESLSSSSPMVSTTPLVQNNNSSSISKQQQTSPPKTPPISNPSSPSPSTSKPRPFLKRTSMSSLPTPHSSTPTSLSASTSSLSNNKTPVRTPLKRESSVGVSKQR